MNSYWEKGKSCRYIKYKTTFVTFLKNWIREYIVAGAKGSTSTCRKKRSSVFMSQDFSLPKVSARMPRRVDLLPKALTLMDTNWIAQNANRQFLPSGLKVFPPGKTSLLTTDIHIMVSNYSYQLKLGISNIRWISARLKCVSNAHQYCRFTCSVQLMDIQVANVFAWFDS